MSNNQGTNNEFKLLAIRPLKDCDKNLRKVLNEGEIYQFYSNYKFKYDDEKNKKDSTIVGIIPNKTNDLNLYYVKRHNTNSETLPINISAIVGKNGSGKSAITELFYALCYNMALAAKILPNVNPQNKKTNSPIENLKVEVFYLLDEHYYRLRTNGENTYISIQDNNTNEFKENPNIYIKEESHNLIAQLFFYTININYSHYSLNALQLGEWVNNLFHKNDGYQTPLVLNPYRYNGDIEINKETHLTFSRLLSIILTPNDTTKANNEDQYYRELLPKKKATHIEIKLNRSKGIYKKEEKYAKFLLENNSDFIFKELVSQFEISLSINKKDSNSIRRLANRYILKKLLTISRKYKRYQASDLQFIKETKPNSEQYEFDKKAYLLFLQELYTDPSHITFKLKQALNFIEHFDTYIEYIKKVLPLTSLAIYLNGLATAKGVPLIEVLPPSFFNVDLQFEEDVPFNTLSSGEKQKIYSTASYLYHIINLNSVVPKKNVYIRYEYINIIFDEIELYYHPELQRTYINDFLESIKRLHIPNIKGINCLFITHSPFILSDIPEHNVLFLNQDGSPKTDTINIKTFAANIHDLLKNSFFLDNGFMGEFAKAKIKETIDFLNRNMSPNEKDHTNDEEEIQRHRKVIEMIGEPILKMKLQDMLSIITRNRVH